MKRLKSKITKRILGIVLILGCSGIFLNGYVGVSDSVYAQNDSTVGTIDNGSSGTSSSIDTMGIWQIMDMFLKIIYLLLWPLLVVAGLALDNTLVYASIFHLDAPLWQFWNMMKNFANFTLGFMVLFAIIKSLLTGGGAGSIKEEKTPLGIIKTTLIAGILIQASWFLMAAMIDVSTIATYAVGGLPLSVLKNTDIGSKKILSVNSAIDLNKFDVLSEKGEGFKVWYSTNYDDGTIKKNVQLSPCRIEQSYIVGRQYNDAKYRNDDIFGEGQSACVAGNQIVIYNEFPNVVDKDGTQYTNELTRVLGAQTDWGPREACFYVINLGGLTPNLGQCGSTFPDINANYANLHPTEPNALADSVTNHLPINTVSTTLGTQGGTTWLASNNVIAMTISDLITKSKGFVGPLVTMYSSLLNFAQLTDTNVSNTSGTSGIFIIKSLVAIALFFPLLALAVVLIARIGVLWLYIVASPLIVLKAVFKDFIKLGAIDDYFDIKQVAGIIFAPVITVAALSISLIFMTALVNGFNSKDVATTQQLHDSLGIQTLQADDKNHDLISVQGITQLEFSKIDGGEIGDRFSRFMVNFFAIGLMWMLVFAAIRANKLGEAIGKPIQEFGQNFFSTLPILKIPGMDGKIGLGTAAKGISSLPERYIDKLEGEQADVVADYMGEGKDKTGKGGTGATFTTDNAKHIVTGLSTLTNLTPERAKQIFTDKNISNPTDHITNNAQVYYDAIKLLSSEEKNKVKTAIDTITGNNDWWAKMEKIEATTKAKEALDDITKSANNIAGFEKIFKTDLATHETTINDYFKAAGETVPYEKTVGDKKYTIKKIAVTPATNPATFTYSIVETPQ